MPRVVHFEIHAGDLNRAVNFYQALFAWTFQKWEGPMEYWLITTGPDEQPGINGGLVQRRGELDGQAVIAYVCTVDVADVDASLATALANGGEVAVPKIAIPGMGWLD
jgi:predicted enzyme related to lactoylglutathione lyase